MLAIKGFIFVIIQNNNPEGMECNSTGRSVT